MSDQILSQEEIDALLSAMSDGTVDLEGEKAGEVEVKNYDLTSHSVILQDQFGALEEVWDKFVGLLCKSLSSAFLKTINAEVVSSEMVNFGIFMKAFSNPTSFNMFNVDPLIGTALLVIEPDIVFSLIDCMFGGEGKPLEQIREFTVIEKEMMNKFVIDVLNDLDKASEDVYPINNSLKKTETKPEYVHVINPDEPTIVVVIKLAGDEFEGNMHLCIPYIMLEPIKDKISSLYLRKKDTENVWSDLIKNLLDDSYVNIVAEIGKKTFAVRELLGLGVDDIISLDIGPHDPIAIKIEGIPKYTGFPGIVKGNRAVEVTSLIKNNGGGG